MPVPFKRAPLRITSREMGRELREMGRRFCRDLTLPGKTDERPRMPIQPRLDAPGALHHVMGRGIERTQILASDVAREDFLGHV